MTFYGTITLSDIRLYNKITKENFVSLVYNTREITTRATTHLLASGRLLSMYPWNTGKNALPMYKSNVFNSGSRATTPGVLERILFQENGYRRVGLFLRLLLGDSEDAKEIANLVLLNMGVEGYSMLFKSTLMASPINNKFLYASERELQKGDEHLISIPILGESFAALSARRVDTSAYCTLITLAIEEPRYLKGALKDFKFKASVINRVQLYIPMLLQRMWYITMCKNLRVPVDPSAYSLRWYIPNRQPQQVYAFEMRLFYYLLDRLILKLADAPMTSNSNYIIKETNQRNGKSPTRNVRNLSAPDSYIYPGDSNNTVNYVQHVTTLLSYVRMTSDFRTSVNLLSTLCTALLYDGTQDDHTVFCDTWERILNEWHSEADAAAIVQHIMNLKKEAGPVRGAYSVYTRIKRKLFPKGVPGVTRRTTDAILDYCDSRPAILADEYKSYKLLLKLKNSAPDQKSKQDAEKGLRDLCMVPKMMPGADQSFEGHNYLYSSSTSGMTRLFGGFLNGSVNEIPRVVDSDIFPLIEIKDMVNRPITNLQVRALSDVTSFYYNSHLSDICAIFAQVYSELVFDSSKNKSREAIWGEFKSLDNPYPFMQPQKQDNR